MVECLKLAERFDKDGKRIDCTMDPPIVYNWNPPMRGRGRGRGDRGGYRGNYRGNPHHSMGRGNYYNNSYRGNSHHRPRGRGHRGRGSQSGVRLPRGIKRLPDGTLVLPPVVP